MNFAGFLLINLNHDSSLSWAVVKNKHLHWGKEVAKG